MVLLARKQANFEVLSFAETRSELEQAFQTLELGV